MGVRHEAKSKCKLTKAFVEKAPEGKHWDSEVVGLGLWVNPTGTHRTFYLQKPFKSKTRRQRLGRFPGLTVAEARKRALALTVEWQNEADRIMSPSHQKKWTLRVAMKKYLERERLAHSTRKGISDRLERHLGDWMNVQLKHIDGAMLVERHREISVQRQEPDRNGRIAVVGGKRVANQVMQNLITIWARADALGAGLGPCPTRAIDFHPEPPSKVFIDDPKTWEQEVRDLQNPIHRALYAFLLYTGLRGKSEAFRMQWDHVLEDRFLIPVNKSQHPFELPRLPCHEPVLDAMRSLHPKWVFPASRGDGFVWKPYPISWSPHAHRRTFGRWAAMELPDRKVGWLLNHDSQNMTAQRYIPLDVDMLRPAMQVAVQEIEKRFPSTSDLIQ